MNENNQIIPLGYKDIPSYKLFECRTPDSIYHYTDYDGASGIIESKSLRLTKLSYLNDTSELTLAINLFKTRVTKWLHNSKDNEKSSFIEEASQQLDSFSNTNICVTSFCEAGDLLSQWRSYGNNGSGIAIEFDAHALKNISNTGLMNMWKCIYSHNEQQEIIDGLIDILSRSYDVVSAVRTKDWESTKKDLIGYFNTTFLRVAPVLKNSHFSEEKEWRIITASRPYTDENWYSTLSNNKVSQYYQLNFDLIDNGKYEFINGVVVGPTSEPKHVADSIRVLLSKNGYNYKHVKYSQIPYRS